ncbi:MAG TPA: NADH-quinone oxidoreductase subunit M [Terriglobia bacterium]|nr:NADH-quinone oxidoreductase subunit M [Terriglobia bacterium]
MQFFYENYLSIILFAPLVGMGVLLFIPGENKNAIRWWGNIVLFGDFLLSLPLVFWFSTPDQSGTHEKLFRFVERHDWIPSIGAQYHLGIDGISFLLIMLTTVLGFISVLSSWTAIQDRVKEYYAMFLLLQVGMLGVFMSLDIFLFYVFWEVMLVPMYFIIGVWGGPRKLYAAIKFFLYTLAGSVLMLLGILALYFQYHTDKGVYTFNLIDLTSHASLWPLGLQLWVFAAFAIGFAIKVPMFPFHTWLPDAHVEAPTAGSVILAGVLLKMGTYGFIRFSLPLLPQASSDPRVVKVMVYISIIGIVYGALVSLMQRDMKKLIAYSSVSHLGFCTLGIFALNPHGLEGSVIQQINHGISTGALFLIVGLIYERRHTREIKEFGGLSNVMPIYATLFMIVMLSSVGLPLLNGFIGEFTILQGAFEANWHWAAWAVSGIVLGAAYMLWLYQRTMFGPCDNPKNQVLKDLNLREVMTLVPLIIGAFWIGLYPKPFFDVLQEPVQAIVQSVHPDFYKSQPQPAAAQIAAPSGGNSARAATVPAPKANTDKLAANLSAPWPAPKSLGPHGQQYSGAKH